SDYPKDMKRATLSLVVLFAAPFSARAGVMPADSMNADAARQTAAAAVADAAAVEKSLAGVPVEFALVTVLSPGCGIQAALVNPSLDQMEKAVRARRACWAAVASALSREKDRAADKD